MHFCNKKKNCHTPEAMAKKEEEKAKKAEEKRKREDELNQKRVVEWEKRRQNRRIA